MNRSMLSRRFAAALCLFPLLATLAACGGLLPAAPAPPAQFALDRAAIAPAALAPRPGDSAPRTTVSVAVPRAAAGFDSSRIVYVRQPYQLEYFAYNQWVDPPAQMLWPLIARALEANAAFKAVVVGPSGVAADWRLDVELIRLQQEFTASPSRVRVTLRAQLIDSLRRSVVASREIEATQPAASDDPYGGVVAANEAVARAVGELAAFAADAARAASAASAAGGVTAPAATQPVMAAPSGQATRPGARAR